jgi:hypothetical protein
MIDPTAVLLALAFWAPYNGGPLPCTGDDVHVYDGPPPAELQLPANAIAYAFTRDQDGNLLPPHCDIYVSRAVADADVSFQCAVIAHEWGHAWKQLSHSPDPHNVMFEREDYIPGACVPPAVTPRLRPSASRHRHARYCSWGGRWCRV